MAKSTVLEVERAGMWTILQATEALERNERHGRCVECKESVRVHRASNNGMAAHVEHLKRNPLCSLSDPRALSLLSQRRVVTEDPPGIHEASRQVAETSTAKAESVVSADQLSTWRRTLIALLNELEPTIQRAADEGLAKRIQRLSYNRLIPRDIAAMMRVVTEMRNMTEYESKVLSGSESAVVVSAWAAIRHWAATRGLKGQNVSRQPRS